MPHLDPTWFASQLFWLFSSFAVLYVLLSRLVLPPLQNVMESRKGTIKSDLETAQDLKQKAEEAKKHYEETLVKSRETARSLIAEAAVSSKERAEEANKALDAQIATQSTNASAAILAKKQELLKDLAPATVEFSSMIVEKLTNHSPSKDELKKAFEVTTPNQ